MFVNKYTRKHTRLDTASEVRPNISILVIKFVASSLSDPSILYVRSPDYLNKIT